MSRARRSSGQPLLVMAAILFVWTGVRVAFLSAELDGSMAARSVARLAVVPPEDKKLSAAPVVARARLAPSKPATQPSPQAGEWRPAPVAKGPSRVVLGAIPREVAPALMSPATRSIEGREEAAERQRTGASHNLLWLAAMARIPIPSEVAGYFDTSQESRASEPGHGKRWSADAWLYLRDADPAPFAAAPIGASYGRSQAGAVLRYRLRPASPHVPSAHLRATASLAGPAQRELALGLNAKPAPRLPLTLHLEGRVSEQGGRTEIRPAAFVTAGVQRADLPFGLSLRSYAQAGYVGGDFATAFADGQFIAERDVARFDLGTLSAGAGAWGGAQKGATRLDVGPTAGITLSLGEMPARLSVDYRVRVAGDAEPGSGAALTLSTGF